ncbi:MAG: 4'-phosphopantetheinyl transferase superfamily protein [Deltaproteobacteria bacterium]|nr:4'-phosphopantetheinyl transferase superfamily protein [Deltaproteobacteria bacterium]
MRRRLSIGWSGWRRRILPHIGNDVVDLTNPANVQRSTDLRLLKKILTDTEIDQVRSAREPAALLWSFWACKEAAYKVMKKQTGDAAFLPRRWSVCFRRPQAADLRSSLRPVEVQNQSPAAVTAGYVASAERDDIPFLLHSFPSYVHSLAADRIDLLDKILWRVAVLPDGGEEGADPSAYVRACLKDDLSGFLRAERTRIHICRAPCGRGELDPPAVYLDGVQTPIEISLSHDGRFAAYAFLM